MSSTDKKTTVKFRYRIVVNDDPDYQYLIERKGWFFWHRVGKSRHLDDAQADVKRLARMHMMKPGTVISEYSEGDYLVDKLKGRHE